MNNINNIYLYYMYDKIVNPETGRKVNINGKLGKKIMANYLKTYFTTLNGGGLNIKLPKPVPQILCMTKGMMVKLYEFFRDVDFSQINFSIIFVAIKINIDLGPCPHSFDIGS